MPSGHIQTQYEKATLALPDQVAFLISCAELVRGFGTSGIRTVLAENQGIN
ncbi:hypothetical protein YSA_00853 [Pseudomonas putida ND6]|uniref:Uncharacterized protein n=1 Tax=Pseudomonas putida ND6 TaxID=231023 RepID=I3UP16_PSEPU|nr:hypothetical protein YSA_00853 [Pseudomonas putida ND6]